MHKNVEETAEKVNICNSVTRSYFLFQPQNYQSPLAGILTFGLYTRSYDRSNSYTNIPSGYNGNPKRLGKKVFPGRKYIVGRNNPRGGKYFHRGKIFSRGKVYSRENIKKYFRQKNQGPIIFVKYCYNLSRGKLILNSNKAQLTFFPKKNW